MTEGFDANNVQLGALIKRLRGEKGLRQQEIVNRMRNLLATASPDNPYYGATGYKDTTALSRLETGSTSAPNARNLHLLATALEVSVESLYHFKDTNEGKTEDLSRLPFVDLELIDPANRVAFAASCDAPYSTANPVLLRLYLSVAKEDEFYNNAKVFTSKNDAMERVLGEGTRVITRRIPDSKWELINNKVCVVVYDDQVTIKGIQENDLIDRNLLTLYPSRLYQAPLRVRRELIKCIREVFEFFDRPPILFKRS